MRFSIIPRRISNPKTKESGTKAFPRITEKANGSNKKSTRFFRKRSVLRVCSFSKRETLKTTWQAVEQLTQSQSESSNENRARNNRATVANCRLHQLTRPLALTIVSSGLLNANIDDANVHVEYVEENFSRAFVSLEKFAVETESLGRLSKIKNYPNSKTLRTNRKFPPFQRRINKIVEKDESTNPGVEKPAFTNYAESEFTTRPIYQKWVVCRKHRAACLNGREEGENGRDVARWYAKLEDQGGILITGLRELAARTEGHKYRGRRVKSLWGISRLARGPLIMQQPAGDQVWRVESEGCSR